MFIGRSSDDRIDVDIAGRDATGRERWRNASCRSGATARPVALCRRDVKSPAVFAKFLCPAVYAGSTSSYSRRGCMDLIFISGIVGFLLLACALAVGCDRLGA